MVLYKYYGYEAGLKALLSEKLGFRRPTAFNDPLELSFPICRSNPKELQFARALETLRESVVILSLTQTPRDPLMWAHYGDSHRGFVIGYDTSDSFLNSFDYNLIIADEGVVTYDSPTSSSITDDFDEAQIQSLLIHGLGAPLDKSTLALATRFAKRAFLTKHPRWSSEKEVRVVKVLTSSFETADSYQSDPLRRFSTLSRLVAPKQEVSIVPGLFLYDHQVRITEVYLGSKNPLFDPKTRGGGPIDATLSDRAATRRWVVRKIRIRSSSWDLDAEDLDHDALTLVERRCLTHDSSFDAEIARFLGRKLASASIDDGDQFTITRWKRALYLNKNGGFI